MCDPVGRLLFAMLWLGLYGYYVEQTGRMAGGAGRRAAVYSIAAMLLAASVRLSEPLIWPFVCLLFLLYDLFFDKEPFRKQWRWIMAAGFLFWGASFLKTEWRFGANGLLLWGLFCLLAAERGCLSVYHGILMAALYGLLSAFLWLYGGSGMPGEPLPGESVRTVLLWGGILAEVLLFLAVEGTLFSYKRSYEVRAEQFQRDVTGYQYEEIKNIYMNMRGWRHDYHNHLQVLKAQLALGNQEEAREYLDKLERDLDRVDTWVKSGNLMVDAVLNGKLSMAEQKQIPVNCSAGLPESLPVEDVDLCVILGNLLDNALESCEKLPAEQRFLRVYMAVNRKQLYVSVQNAAKEELDFKERNYITDRRGEHGFGMKRVQALVEKYEGYLHLANEPGIFAAEVTIPL